MALIRPGPLPTYAWARTPVAGVPRDGWERGLPAVTALDPGALPDAPPATTGDLVQLGHPLIRTLGAYWHEGWPFARPETWVRTEVADRLGEAAERLPAGFGLAVWDALRSTGVMAFGVETYANSRRMEKSLRLQNADLLTEYNLYEADLARPKVKEADFRGKAKHLEYRARTHQPAMLCTLTVEDNVDSRGVARYPVGICPVLDPVTGETLVDSEGRRSFTTSMAYGPTIGKNIALAYLPHEWCELGRELEIEYFAERYPVRIAGIGYQPLYDPENAKPRS